MKRIYWDLLQYITASIVCGALLGGAIAGSTQNVEAKKSHKKNRALPAYTMEEQ